MTKIPVDSSFYFLQNDFPKLFSYAFESEKRYTFQLYDDCITNLGVFAEVMVSYIVSDFELELDDNTQYGRINVLYDMKIIPLKQYNIFHTLRIARNDFLHKKASFSKASALDLLKKAFELAKWFADKNGIDVDKLHFVAPNPSSKEDSGKNLRKDGPDYINILREMELNGEYNKAVLYSIIIKKVNNIRKHINEPLDAPIKSLAELYISLRTKKDVPLKKKLMFAELKKYATEYIYEEDMDALILSFCAAYQDALSSLSGSIKQIVGDLE